MLEKKANHESKGLISMRTGALGVLTLDLAHYLETLYLLNLVHQN